VKIGVMLPIGETDGPAGAPRLADLAAFARAVEDGGFDSAWLADHFFYRSSTGEEFGLHEAWTTLATVAAVTSRIQVGTLVLCTSFRNPALTAKMAATLDALSDGRLVLGLGCGWHDPEYAAMGLPVDHRVGRFEEALEVITRLLAGERVTFHGTYETVDDAVLLPPPDRQIPILIAARRERMLRLTAARADAWNTAWYGAPDDRLRTRLTEFDTALEVAGRTRSDVTVTVGIDVRDPDQPPVPEPNERAIAGSVGDLAAALAAYRDLGVGHLMVGLEPMTVRSVERLAEAVRLVRAG
jgi:probable F420-dependent oxidoreductase